MSLNTPLEFGPTLTQRVLFKRSATSSSSSSSATTSNGCVVCDDTPTCPSCKSGESCVQTVQTCSQCPTTYCKTVSGTSTTSSTNIGAIVGGIIGGIVGLALVFYILYRYYFKNIFAFNRVQQKEYYFDDDIEINFHHNLPPDAYDPNLVKPATRTSLATTILSRASNIIPIAYIPGVTIGANQKNRMSTVSSTGTIDSDLIGDRFSKASIVGNPSLTTTAIRAKPKLVTVSNSDILKTAGEDTNRDSIPGTAVSVNQLGGVRSVRINKPYQKSALSKNMVIKEEEEEEEEEEPLVSLKRIPTSGTGISRNSVTQIDDDYDPFIIDDDESQSDKNDYDDDDSNRRASKVGSVLLEVEMDTQSRVNPFKDESSLSSNDK